MKLEKELGRKLYNTYYYDRFYFPGQALTRHADRDACEISVTVHVSTNLEGKDADWRFGLKLPIHILTKLNLKYQYQEKINQSFLKQME